MCCLYHPGVSVGILRHDSHRSWGSESGIAQKKELSCADYELKAIEAPGLMAFTSPLFQRGIRHSEGKTPMCSAVPALCLPRIPGARERRLHPPAEMALPRGTKMGDGVSSGGLEPKKVCKSGWICMLHTKDFFSLK